MKNLIDKIKTKFSLLNKIQKCVIIAISAYIGAAIPTGMILSSIHSLSTNVTFSGVADENYSLLRDIFFSKTGIFIEFIILTVFALIYLSFLIKNRDKLHSVKSTDSRGLKFSTSGANGTSEPLSVEKAKIAFDISPIEKNTGIILGALDEGQKEVVSIGERGRGNRHGIIYGPSGSGKTYCFVNNAILQSVKRGESFVVTDPKNALYGEFANYLESQGYIVKLFNLVDIVHSNTWDCMGEIVNPLTGNIEQMRVITFVDVILKNTTEGKEDSFWSTGERNLFTALVSFVGYRWEKQLFANIENVLTEIMEEHFAFKSNGLSADEQEIEIANYNDLLEKISSPHTYVNEKRDIYCDLYVELGGTRENALIEFNKVYDIKDRCTISEVFYILVTQDLNQIETLFKGVPISHPASIAWSIFKQGGTVSPNFVLGLSGKLSYFAQEDIRNISSQKDIDLSLPGEKKCAYFCGVDDKSTSLKFLSSVFFTFLFKDLADAADVLGPENRLPVNIICDEFANLGEIPQFVVLISTLRSRKINVYIIIQALSQLQHIYTKEETNTILSNIDYILFLGGCNDEDTSKYLSSISGEATVKTSSLREARNVFQMKNVGDTGYDESTSEGKRNVYTASEIRNLGEKFVLIKRKNFDMLKAYSYGYVNHPEYKNANMTPRSIQDMIPTYERFVDTNNLDGFTRGEVDKLAEKNKRSMKKKKIATLCKERGEDDEIKKVIKAVVNRAINEESDTKQMVMNDLYGPDDSEPTSSLPKNSSQYKKNQVNLFN